MLTLYFQEGDFELNRGMAAHVAQTVLCVAPDRRLYDAVLALPRSNERTYDPERDAVDDAEVEIDRMLEDPAPGYALIVGAGWNGVSYTSWEVTAGDFKRVRGRALTDRTWWAGLGTHNRAILAYVNELPDSTTIIVVTDTSAMTTPSN